MMAADVMMQLCYPVNHKLQSDIIDEFLFINIMNGS